MTDDERRGEPADDNDEIADSLDIDETAAQHPSPGHAAPTDANAAADSPAEPVGSEPAATESADESDATEPADESSAAPPSTGRRGRRRGKPKKPRRKAPWWELPALVGLAIVIAILVKTFLVQPFYIPSQSMEKTLHGCPGCSGDRILVSKIVYDFRDPHPGDIVVFNAPKGWNDEPPSVPPSNPILRVIRGFGQLVGFIPPDGLVLVKRVIATGGQTVKGDAVGHVFISNHGAGGPWRELNETYVYETGGIRVGQKPKKGDAFVDQRAAFGPITVPKGRLWVMGDHRDESADSRYHCAAGAQDDNRADSSCDVTSATVPISAVIGKAFVIAWPPSRWTTLGTPKDFTTAADGLAGAGFVPIMMVSPLFFIRRRKRR